MKKNWSPFLESYGFSILLIISILIGAALGIALKQGAAALKPLGDIFLNLLFTVSVPLVFFSISATVASMTDLRRLGKILSVMVLIFVITGVISSAVMIVAVILFPPAVGVHIPLPVVPGVEQIKTVDQIVRTFTAPDFSNILSRNNMMALIVFSILLMQNVSLNFRLDRLGSALAGLVGGFLCGSVGLPGPPMALLLSSQGFQKEEFRRVIVVFLTALDFFTFGYYSLVGLITADMLLHGLKFLPAMVLGFLVGRFAFGRVTEAHFRRLTLGITLAAGVLPVSYTPLQLPTIYPV